MSSLAQHGVLRRLDRAFQAFYRRVRAGQAPGFPKFKSRRAFRSLTWPQYGNGAKLVDIGERNGRIALTGVGTSSSAPTGRFPRPPSSAKSRSCTHPAAAGGSGRLRTPRSGGRESDGPVEPVGIDLGIHTFVALSTGERIPGPGPDGGPRADAQTRPPAGESSPEGLTESTARRPRLARVYEKVSRRPSHPPPDGCPTTRPRALRTRCRGAAGRTYVRSARGTVEQPGTEVRQKAGLNREILRPGLGGLRALPRGEGRGGWRQSSYAWTVTAAARSAQRAAVAAPKAAPPARAPMPGLRAHGGSRRRRRTSHRQACGPHAQRLGREPGGGRASGRTDEAESRVARSGRARTRVVTGGWLSSRTEAHASGRRGAGWPYVSLDALIETLVKHAALRLRRLVENDHVPLHPRGGDLSGFESLLALSLGFGLDVLFYALGSLARLAASSEEQQADRRSVRILRVGEGTHGPVLLARLMGKTPTDRRLLARRAVAGRSLGPASRD